jgi:hypothetical protein
MSAAISGSGTLRPTVDFPLRTRIGHGHAGHGFFHFGHALLHGALWLTVIVMVLVVVAIALLVRRFTARRSRRPF